MAEPAVLATVVLCLILTLVGIDGLYADWLRFLLISLGVVGTIYAFFMLYIIIPSPIRLKQFKWPSVIANAGAVIAGVALLSGNLLLIPLTIMALVSLITRILWDRKATYIYLLISGLGFLAVTIGRTSFTDTMLHSVFFLVAVFFVETVERLYAASQKRVDRLQAINNFARQVSASVDLEDVVDLIGTAIKNSLQADTYYFGMMEGEQFKMQLIHDEGVNFEPQYFSLEGSLTGWVLRNQQPLFIPDMRYEVELEGVSVVLMGKEKASLCWMGVPLNARHTNGIIAVASYQQNDFSRTDLELLENLAQQAGLVLDNAYHHAQVEAQSRLDSLTGVYNHGHIVKVLNEEAQKCLQENLPLSLIMLDIDFFKQYNDNYGHVVGDQVLVVLNQAIRQHIKATDSIGRWGGEEFTIVLPGTNGLQAQQVALRVQNTINTLSLTDRVGKQMPFPTVSQGLAVFPYEANDVFKLIDLADQRLYTAKQRGRNQVEPSQEDWNPEQT